MKNYFKITAIAFGAFLIMSGVSVKAAAQYNNDTNNGNNYNYDNGYNDNQTYDYNQQQNGSNFDQQQNEPAITFNDFYSQLAPYGRWLNDPSYGRIWIANAPNFQPYSSNGYWSYTSYGWTWVSNYSWGWAPFHYGRWGFSNNYGWYWVPGYNWGPAWVNWSSGSGVYGWAPLGPGMAFGIGISIGSIPYNYWTFMPSRYMGYRNINSYYYSRSRNNVIIRNTTIINNYGNSHNNRYSRGPQARDVARITGRAVKPVRIVNSNSSRNTGIKNNELHVYRPGARTNVNPQRNGSVQTNRGNVKVSGRTPRTVPQRSTTPVQRTQTPVQRTVPQRSNTPVQRTQTPVQRTVPQRSNTPVKRTQTPVKRTQTPVQRTVPQRSTTPVQRTAPVKRESRVQKSVPTRSSSSSRSRSTEKSHR